MKDNYGDKETASPSTAVQMSGLNAVPIAGDDFSVATSLDEVSFEPHLMSHSVTCVYRDTTDPLLDRSITSGLHPCNEMPKR